MATYQSGPQYIAWQNNAFRFYVAARVLYLNEQYAPAAFCAIQCVELLLKGTLMYWDKSFDHRAAGHKIAAMIRTVRNKVRGARKFDLPSYYYSDKRFYSVSRYVTPGKGVIIPGTFLSDLDSVFAQVVSLVPFQFNSELRRAISGKNRKNLLLLRRQNHSMKNLRLALT